MKLSNLFKILPLIFAIGFFTSCDEDEETTTFEQLETSIQGDFSVSLKSSFNESPAFLTAYSELEEQFTVLNDIQLNSCDIVRVQVLGNVYHEVGGEEPFATAGTGWDDTQGDMTFKEMIQRMFNEVETVYSFNSDNPVYQLDAMYVWRNTDDGLVYTILGSEDQVLDLYNDCDPNIDGIEWVATGGTETPDLPEPSTPITSLPFAYCVYYNFPVTVLVTDSSSNYTQTSEVVATNNTELENLLFNESDEQYVTDFVYPVVLTTTEGNDITVYNVDEFYQALLENSDCQ